MSTAQNVACVRHAVKAIWNRGDLAVADAVFAPAYVNHGGLIIDVVRGPESIKLSVALYRRAFPDLHITVTELLGAGDQVELHWVARRAGAPGVSGSAARAAPGTVSGMTVSRFADGHIVESWTHWDQGTVLDKRGRSQDA